MKRRRGRIWLVLSLGTPLAVGACGGATPPATTTAAPAPSPPTTAAPAPIESEPDASSPPSDEVEQASPPAPPRSEPDTLDTPDTVDKASRSPREILGAPRVAFMVNYPASAPSQTAESSCAAKADDDPQVKAQCKAKARSEFMPDVLVFRKDGERWTWTIYRRDGGTLFEVSTSAFAFGDETENSVELVMLGASKGQRPLFNGQKEVLVSVPTNYRIELDDPRYGHLVYEGKIGLVDE